MPEHLRRQAAKEKSAPALPGDSLVPLESILCTEELKRRPSRPPDYETENRALVELAQALADSPRTILQTLADVILKTLKADSAGMSLLTKDKKRFYWAAIAGAWKAHLGGGTQRDFGPCGDVLDRDSPLLFTHWEQRYPYLLAATPLAEEGLLIPFHVAGKAVGTIWAITHQDRRKFDAEDLRQLESLGRFASAAYQAGASLDASLGARDQHRAALNLMEDAVLSRQATEALNLELRESEERFRTLFELGPVAVYSCDLAGVIQNFNRRAGELWGREPATGDTDERFCGSFKLFRPDGSFMPHDQCPMAEVVSGKIPEARDQEVLIERPDGSRITVVVNIRPLKNERGEVTGGINCFYDISDRKQAEAALIKSEKLAASGRLAATLAHEINNPLQAVVNLIDLLRKAEGLNEQERGYATMAGEELLRVARLTQQSLRFYRESTAPETINLEEKLESILELYSKPIQDKKIEVRRRFKPGGSIVHSYRGELRQVFTTLLVNAMEAVPPGGKIIIRVRKGCGVKGPVPGVWIMFADNGMGIPARNADKIFEPFFTTKGERGSGLGLWVARGILDRLGGEIRVRSSVRKGKSGTCFLLFLPEKLP